MRDAGSWCGSLSEFMKLRAKGSIRLGTIFNDIWPRNIGASGLIFDPALNPIQKGIYWVGTGVLVVGGGFWMYFEIKANE